MGRSLSGYATYQDFGGRYNSGDMDTLHLRRAVEGEIQQAFHGVTLDKGMSLRRAQYADRFQDAVWNAHSTSLSKGEITNDWSQVSLDELERDCIALLDPFGFRYYIPALMLSVLDHYDSSSMRVIGTLSGLYPKKIACPIPRISILSSTPRKRRPSPTFLRHSLSWLHLILRIKRSCCAP